MATAEAAPLPEGDWASLLERIKGGDDAESLEPLAHQLYAAVSAAGRRHRPPPLSRPRVAAATLPAHGSAPDQELCTIALSC